MPDLPDLPITTDEIIGAFRGDGLTTEEKYLLEGQKWNGKGKPPSRDAAIGWLIAHEEGMTIERARKIVGTSGTLTTVGDRVRKRPSLTQIRAAEAEQNEKELAGKRVAGPAKGPQQAQVDAAAEALGMEGDDLGALLGGVIGAPETDTRGAPLWRFEGSPEQLAELTVENNSQVRSDRGHLGGGRNAWGGPSRTSARYFEQDTLEPLKWSAEQRADLQRVLHGIGLYGKDAKVKLGSWGAKDQAVYAELLASANEEGLTWMEMLTKWKRQPPEDLLADLDGAGGSKRAPLVVQHTNPTDVRSAARDVSRNLTGETDRGFVERAPGGYNQIETQAQTAAYSATDPEGGGGTVTDAPSVGAYLDEKLRRENPIEVDGYQFLNQFQRFMSMLGVQ